MIWAQPFKILVCAGLVSIALSGCQNAGTVGGSVAGGLIGSAFGSGSGRTAAIIGGSLLGGYVGNRTIDQRRYDRYNSRYRRRYY